MSAQQLLFESARSLPARRGGAAACRAALSAAAKRRDVSARGLPPSGPAFGIYVFGGGEGVRGAAVEVGTGEFVGEGAQTPLADPSPEALSAAVVKLVTSAGWEGPIGIGLPGRVQDWGNASPGDWAAGRASRASLERLLTAATGFPAVCLSGAEVAGYGEMAYGGGAGVSGLVLTATIGTSGFGVALFDEGVLVRGVDVRSIMASWREGEAAAPPPMDDSPAKQWAAWAERVDRTLLQLESLLHPTTIVLGGSATRGGLERLIGQLTVRERVPGGVRPATLSIMGTVKGAAYGCLRELATRKSLAAVRTALGASVAGGGGPQALTVEQLRSLFDQFAAGEARLSLVQLSSMLRGLGLSLPQGELRQAFAALAALGGDGGGEGVSWEALQAWWAANVSSEAVEYINSADEYHQALRDEAHPGGRPVCVEVGMTFCRPCKAFERTYKTVAGQYPAVRFLRLNGNENRSCTVVARDILGVRSTPAFYFFRNGDKPVANHTGANEQRLRDALESLLAPPGAAEALTPVPPPPKGIDTSSAKESGLSTLLADMSAARAKMDALRAQLRHAEEEMAVLERQLQLQTGVTKLSPR